MEEVLLFSSVLLPIVLAVVELIKKTINLPKNLIPLISLIVGMIIGALAYPFTGFDLVLRLWAGAFAGLSGTGLFEVIKKREGMTKNIAQG